MSTTFSSSQGPGFRRFPGTVQADAFTSRYGKGLAIRVTNNSGSDIPRDSLVVITGWDSTNKIPQVVLANATTQGHDDVYVTLQKITNGGAKGGYIYKGGLSAATLNTNSASVGDNVYLSDSVAGSFVLTTAPTSTNARQIPVGFVKAVSATVGQIRWSIKSVPIQEPTAGFYAASVTAAGTNQATAQGISANSAGVITITGANTSNGVALPAATPGKVYILQNSVTNQNCTVYANPGGDVINALSSTSGFTLAAAKGMVAACAVAGTWFTILTA